MDTTQKKNFVKKSSSSLSPSDFIILDPACLIKFISSDQLEYLETTINFLDGYVNMNKKPREIISILGTKISLYIKSCFFHHLWTFNYILTLPKTDKTHGIAIENIKEHFKEQTREEWCLLYLEYYLWNNWKGSEYFQEMHLQDGIFNEHAIILYNPNNEIYLQSRKIVENPRTVVKKLRQLFFNLDMPQVTKRSAPVIFDHHVLARYEGILEKHCFSFLKKSIREFKDNWRGNWYIFDPNLFVNELLDRYGGKDKNWDQSRQETQACYLFVSVIYFILSGELTTWKQLATLKFDDLVKNSIKTCVDQEDLKKNI